MRILALDIGSGTEDILLYDNSRVIENCVKIVLPSPSLVYSKKIRYLTNLKSDIFVKGDTIGGGQFVAALKKHLAKGFKITITSSAAYSIRNNLEEVRSQGFQVVPWETQPSDFKGEIIEINEINISSLQTLLDQFEEDITDVEAIAIAVQDHGIPQENLSNRRFRIDSMRKRLTKYPKLESLAYNGDEVPDHFIRMRSAVKATETQMPGIPVLLMDTSFAAILGCLEDPHVKTLRTVLSVNIGNEHVTAAIVSRNKVLAVLEHHTCILTPKRLESLLKAFMKGEVTDNFVFEEGGHGVFYMKDPRELPKIDMIAVTGPNRAKLQNSKIKTYFAAPGGDMMMTGPMGLVRATKAKLKQTKLLMN